MLLILHIISGLEVGGAEVALFRLISNSQTRNYTHTVISLSPNGAMRNRLQSIGINVYSLDFKKYPIKHFFKLLSILKNLRPDIVQTWMYHADLVGGIAARLVGLKNVIWGVRSTHLSKSISRLTILIRQICAWLSPHIPHTIIFVAESARYVHTQIGYSAKRIKVIPNGFDVTSLRASEKQSGELNQTYNIKAEELIIGCVARFSPDKDIKNFVQAAEQIALRFNSVRFLMVGRNIDRDNKELAGWINQTACSDRFILLGERSDVSDCLSIMDIFCLSSRTEAFPNALGEAMAMGLVCVATDVGDVAALVGDTGKIVPKENFSALADALIDVIEIPKHERIELGIRAKNRIESEFTLEKACKRYEDLYQQIAAEKGDQG